MGMVTVKNGELYMGRGKEYTPGWVYCQHQQSLDSILNARGEIRRVSWVKQYNFVRNVLGAQSPGYLIHEAINWSPHLKKWVFAPRRISAKPMMSRTKRGSNKVVLVNEDFTDATVVTNMKSKDGLHGFSSFAFIPGTQDHHVLFSVIEEVVG